ncbi:ATP-binding cassette domain-containing protein [Propioniciclava coleopterorum]|uniref:ATP-binding cassette domain-containing protein n=1 Tax=Propioniciclava coleopterorum TaxID=2714937 RepID=A0A6G7Y8A0_9ACTN|nr:ATP-binding cassette domain-containing protein [Propioniciclava coleopterorum]
MDDVAIVYPKQGRRPEFRAAEHINLRIDQGEVIGLVGESGSGKTTIGRAAVALLPVREGKLVVAGHDITNASMNELKPFRKTVGIVFQDPGSSLNPRLPVGSPSASRCCCTRASRAPSSASASRPCSTRCTCRAPCATATRTSCRAASGSASASPGRWR